MIYYKMGILDVIASAIITIMLLFILSSPFIGWPIYSYIFSKLIYSFAKRRFNLNISFRRTWVITFLSGMTSFIIIILIFIFLFISYSINVTTIDYFIAIIVTVFITSLIAYKYLSNLNLRTAIIMSFATILAYLSFIIMLYTMLHVSKYLSNIFLPHICCAQNSIK